MRQRHVLVVEDHHLVRHVIARSLRSAGFQVSEADHAERAAELLVDATIDAAVLDVSLPGSMNGIQLGRWLRARQAALPLVFISGMTDWEIVDAIPDDPRSRFLRKPFGARVIVDLVSGLLSDRYGMGAVQSAD
ncbi:MAG: response regulator [Alphaproteobacteria bacterium]|nr:response regulator [Alphaproteobacteria bacterium]